MPKHAKGPSPRQVPFCLDDVEGSWCTLLCGGYRAYGISHVCDPPALLADAFLDMFEYSYGACELDCEGDTLEVELYRFGQLRLKEPRWSTEVVVALEDDVALAHMFGDLVRSVERDRDEWVKWDKPEGDAERASAEAGFDEWLAKVDARAERVLANDALAAYRRSRDPESVPRAKHASV